MIDEESENHTKQLQKWEMMRRIVEIIFLIVCLMNFMTFILHLIFQQKESGEHFNRNMILRKQVPKNMLAAIISSSKWWRTSQY